MKNTYPATYYVRLVTATPSAYMDIWTTPPWTSVPFGVYLPNISWTYLYLLLLSSLHRHTPTHTFLHPVLVLSFPLYAHGRRNFGRVHATLGALSLFDGVVRGWFWVYSRACAAKPGRHCRILCSAAGLEEMAFFYVDGGGGSGMVTVPRWSRSRVWLEHRRVLVDRYDTVCAEYQFCVSDCVSCVCAHIVIVLSKLVLHCTRPVGLKSPECPSGSLGKREHGCWGRRRALAKLQGPSSLTNLLAYPGFVNSRAWRVVFTSGKKKAPTCSTVSKCVILSTQTPPENC